MADPDNFRVAPSLGGTPRVLDQPIESNAPMQLQRMGNALQQAGAQAGNIYTDMLREANAARVTDALTQLTEERNLLTYDPDYGWQNLTGGNAVNRPDGQLLTDEFGSQLDNKIENLSMQLGNDAQRRMFRERADAMGLDFRARIDAHLATESRRYSEETYAGMAQTGQNQLAQARSQQELDEARGMIAGAAGQLFSLRGTPEEARQNTLRELMTPGHLAQLQRRMHADDIEGAENYLNENRDDLTPEAAMRAERQLIEQRTIRDAYQIGEEVFGLAAADNAAAAPQQVGMPFLGAFTATGQYGENRGTHRHGGIDWAMPVGTPVRAGASGTVRVRSGGGYGNYVDLVLDNGTTLRMAHLDRAEVENGQRVNAGDVIARSGNTGRSTGAHLHYEVIDANGNKQDPVAWHQGRPTVQSGQRATSWSQITQNIVSRGLPPRTEQLALERARTLWQAQEETRREQEDNLISRAYAEIDSNNSLSAATRAQIVSAGLGSNLPSLRSFEGAARNRRAGVTLDPAMSLEAYGRARVAVARGEITTVDQLLQFRPYMGEAQMRSLFDDMANNPQGARDRAARAIDLVEDTIAGTGLFKDANGRQSEEQRREYNRFVGAVVSSLEGREVNGQPQSYEQDREIVLGLLRNSGQMGIRNYQVRELYDNVPAAYRLRRTRELEREGIPATQARLVQDWQALSDGARGGYSTGAAVGSMFGGR